MDDIVYDELYDSPDNAGDGIQPVPLPHRPTHDDIAILAEQRWQALGQPEGQDLAIWLHAETSLLQDLDD